MQQFLFQEITDSAYSYSDVVSLIKSSFIQWEENGVHSALLEYTPEHFREQTKDGIILTVTDTEKAVLIGSVTLFIKDKNTDYPYCKIAYLAIHPDYKGKGFARLLLREVERIARKSNCFYINSDTSVHAKWSIKWHKRNGFHIVGLDSFTTNNYYSYVFRKELTPSSVWNNPFYRKSHFIMASLKTKALLKPNGSFTFIGQLYRKIIRSFKG